MFFLKGFIDFLKIYFRKPRFLVMVCMLLTSILVMLAVYGERVVSNIPIYVVDFDNSTVSRTIRTFLSSSSDLHVLGAIDTPEKARDALYNGEAVAVVVIPDGLSESVKRQEGGDVAVYVDGTSMLLARNVDKAIQTVIKTTSVGVSMIALNKQGVPDFALMGALQPVNLDVDRPFNALTIYSDYLLPVLIFFCLNIFICLMTCAVFQEKLPGDVASHQIRRRFFYLGRLTAVCLVSVLGGIAIYLFGLPRVDIVLQSMPLMALTALLGYVILTQAMFTNINLLLPVSFAMSLSYLLCMLSVMFSGLTWPIEMMPWLLQEIVTWIPLTPFLQAVQVFLYHDANWADLSDFGLMYLKQGVLWIGLAFILLWFRDIRIFFKWVVNKFRRPKLAVVSPEGAVIEMGDSSEVMTEKHISEPEFEIGSEKTQNAGHEVRSADESSAEKLTEKHISEPEFEIGTSEIDSDVIVQNKEGMIETEQGAVEKGSAADQKTADIPAVHIDNSEAEP